MHQEIGKLQTYTIFEQKNITQTKKFYTLKKKSATKM